VTDPKALASIPTQCFLPDETIGEFTERFTAVTQGRAPDLIALAVWRMCHRAYCDGLAERKRLRE
jgi:hypothetical protein